MPWTPNDATSGGGGNTAGTGVVSGNPAYPGSDIWGQGVWSYQGLQGSPSAGAGGQDPTYGNVDAGTLFQQLGAVDPTTMRAYQKKLIQAQLLSPTSLSKGGADDATMSAFAELFMMTIRANQGVPPSKRQTWDAMLDSLAKSGSAYAAKLAEQKYAAAHQPTTTTSEQVYKTGADDAEGYLTQAMTELLGRAPSKKEVAAFTSRLNTKEAANPTVTTTHNDGYGNTTSSTESSDVSAGAVAANYAGGNKFDKERGAYSIQQYAMALENLLGGGA